MSFSYNEREELKKIMIEWIGEGFVRPQFYSKDIWSIIDKLNITSNDAFPYNEEFEKFKR